MKQKLNPSPMNPFEIEKVNKRAFTAVVSLIQCKTEMASSKEINELISNKSLTIIGKLSNNRKLT